MCKQGEHLIHVICRLCKKEFNFYVSDDQFQKYKKREDCIQDIFPELSPIDRELLNSAICGDCWDELFPPEV